MGGMVSSGAFAGRFEDRREGEHCGVGYAWFLRYPLKAMVCWLDYMLVLMYEEVSANGRCG